MNCIFEAAKGAGAAELIAQVLGQPVILKGRAEVDAIRRGLKRPGWARKPDESGWVSASLFVEPARFIGLVVSSRGASAPGGYRPQSILHTQQDFD